MTGHLDAAGRAGHGRRRRRHVLEKAVSGQRWNRRWRVPLRCCGAPGAAPPCRRRWPRRARTPPPAPNTSAGAHRSARASCRSLGVVEGKISKVIARAGHRHQNWLELHRSASAKMRAESVVHLTRMALHEAWTTERLILGVKTRVGAVWGSAGSSLIHSKWWHCHHRARVARDIGTHRYRL